MKFCTQCGKTLSILDDSGTELCPTCSQKDSQTTSSLKNEGNTLNGLSSASLSIENGKIVLKSEEGWLLWSGNADEIHSLKRISDRAERILNIRKKRK